LGIGQPGFVFLPTHTKYIDKITEFITPQDRFGLIDYPKVLNIMPFKAAAISTHWEMIFTRSLFSTVDIARKHDTLNEVAKLLDARKIVSKATEPLGKKNVFS
jgi:hypothetical protein